MKRFALRSRRPLLLLLGLLLLDYLLYPIQPRSRVRAGDRGENGIWLRYPWYFGRHTDFEVAALGRRLRRLHLRYAYFHVRHVQSDGSLRYRYPQAARRLVGELRRSAPEVVPMAWVYAGNNGAGGLPRVDLASRTVRRRMAEEAAWLVREGGFRGVQWDYEICRDGDPYYPLLLRETRAALRKLPGPPLVGACTALWSPAPFPGWREASFTRLARECDQLAVMGYDSGLYLPRAYAWLMAEQVRRVPAAARAGNPDCRVLIGVPTYGRGGLSHHGWAESLPNALRGIADGLRAAGPARESLAGVALFADYTTQRHEWADYEALWMDPEGIRAKAREPLAGDEGGPDRIR